MAFNINMAESNSEAKFWNKTDPNKEGYSLQIVGTLVEVKERQRREFGTGLPLFWNKAGNRWTQGTNDQGFGPLLEYWLYFKQADGTEVIWSVNLGSARKPTAAGQALIDAAEGKAGSIGQLFGGKQMQVATADGTYGAGRPRPFKARVLGDGDAPFRGETDWQDNKVSEPEPQAQPQVNPVQAVQDAWPQAQVQPQPQVQASPYADEDFPF